MHKLLRVLESSEYWIYKENTWLITDAYSGTILVRLAEHKVLSSFLVKLTYNFSCSTDAIMSISFIFYSHCWTAFLQGLDIFNCSPNLVWVANLSQKTFEDGFSLHVLWISVFLQDAKKGVLFIDFPPVLQLHLKRFEYDFMRDTMVKVSFKSLYMLHPHLFDWPVLPFFCNLDLFWCY